MIRAEGLCKQFVRNKVGDKKKRQTKEEFLAVDHVSLQVEDGEIVGILGPNGAGKTTLLRMLGSLMEPTEGRVVLTDFEGAEVTDMVERKKTDWILIRQYKAVSKTECEGDAKIICKHL